MVHMQAPSHERLDNCCSLLVSCVRFQQQFHGWLELSGRSLLEVFEGVVDRHECLAGWGTRCLNYIAGGYPNRLCISLLRCGLFSYLANKSLSLVWRFGEGSRGPRLRGRVPSTSVVAHWATSGREEGLADIVSVNIFAPCSRGVVSAVSEGAVSLHACAGLVV